MPTVRYSVIEGEIIAEKRGGVRKLYVPDPLGSTVALLDNTQAQTDTFSYWPYGEGRTHTGTTLTPFQFVGTAGYYKDSTSRAYVRARTLDMSKGQWVTKDPVFDANAGFSSAYRYAINNPIVMVDRSGNIAQGPIEKPIGRVPPGSHLPGGAFGYTDCSYAGDIWSIIDISLCFAKCIDAHEAQHRYNQKECCKRAGKCMSHAKTKSQAESCYIGWNVWREYTDNRDECQSYKNEQLCLEHMIADGNCYGSSPSSICQQLFARLAFIHGQVNWFCGPQRWPLPPPVRCPFLPDGSIRK